MTRPIGRVDGTATQTTGDADGNGNVDGDDYLIWQTEFGGRVARDGVAGVPEPDSLVIAELMGGLYLPGGRRKIQ